MPPAVERRPSMTSAAELRDQMLNRRTSSATEAQAMRERNVDADMLNRQEMREHVPHVAGARAVTAVGRVAFHRAALALLAVVALPGGCAVLV